MALIDSLLTRDEQVLLEARRHPLFMFLQTGHYILGAILIWVVGVLAMLYIPEISGTDVGNWLGLAIIAAGFLPLAIGAYRMIFWWREKYYITTYRIIQVEGTVNRRTFDSALEKVNDVVMSQSLFGRMFNYGTINIITGSDAAINDIAGVSNPVEFKRRIVEAKLAFSGHGLHEDFAPARPVARYDGQPTQADTNRLPEVDATKDQSRAIVALTELRNSGVLTEAEFDAKLRDLTDS